MIGVAAVGLIISPYLDLRKIPRVGKRLGELVIDKKGIMLNSEVINLSDIIELSIRFNSHRKKKVAYKWALYYRQAGTENTLEVRTDKKVIKCNFMILNNNHRTDLIKTLEYFYKAGLFVKEAGRTYLGKDLSYEEIQEFKKKYGLKGNGY